MRIVIFALLVILAGLATYQFFFFETTGSAEGTQVIVSDELNEVVPRDIVMSGRDISLSASIVLPVPGSAPIENVKHSVPLEEVRLGCSRQDCIPSIEDPEFISPATAATVLPEESIGIALSYKGEERFYPFPMLETREIVNDVVAGDPLLITYCPLCGTGIVFDRVVGDQVYEFGVSGMLWQSNLLMYNRAESIQDRNLWSQVLGEAVIGEQTGVTLSVIPSDIMKFTDWQSSHSETGVVLNSGVLRDPYGGEYFRVASHFEPNFDLQSSPLPPMEYVYGIMVGDSFMAYPRAELPVGETVDEVNGEMVTITRTEAGSIIFENAAGEIIPDVEGFWFSWVAAHPTSGLWRAS